MAFERLLARVFSGQSDSFVLKGGYAMELRFATARATKDIDLTCLFRLNAADETIEAVIAEELRHLIRIDLEDYFSFEIGLARMDLENAPYGGARYSVSSFIDRRLFVKFQLDIGADIVIDEIEQIEGTDWLSFCEISAPIMRMISVEQQFAEKLHAYTLPREHGQNSRVKDLIDMILLKQLRSIDKDRFQEALKRVFNARSTHVLEESLNPPPSNWEPLYKSLAAECGVSLTIEEAFRELEEFFRAHVLVHTAL